MVRRFLGLACAILAVSSDALAQESDAGLVGFPMLYFNYDARRMAMAGASIGMPNDIYGTATNPAALGYVKDAQGLVGYRSVTLDVWGGLVGFGLPLGKTGYWALSAINLSEGTVDETIDLNGEPAATGRVFRSDDVAGGLSWSRLVWKALSVGVTVKGMYSYIGTEGEYYSADGLAMDLGVQYRFWTDRLVLGLVMRNLGFMQSSYATDLGTYEMPLTVGAGLSYVPRYVPAFRFALDVEKAAGRYLNITPAVEIAVLKDLLFIRAGYPFSEREVGEGLDMLGGSTGDNYDKAQWNSLCFGLGLKTSIRDVKVAIDAAVELHTIDQASVGVSGIFGF